MKPSELEKRLGVAYDAGYFDGYCGAIDRIHQDWAKALEDTKGIGPVLRSRIFKAMHDNYTKMRAERGADTETQELVKEALEDGRG